jgi:starvation-inducible DNA-binding protein
VQYARKQPLTIKRSKAMANISRSSAAAQRRESADTKGIAQAISKENDPKNAVVQDLQRQVANAFVLFSNYKHYHWQSHGPLFRDLHLLFDEFAAAVLATIDDFAERIRMIGQNPVARPQEVLDTCTVKVAAFDQTMRQMVEEADANLLIVIKEMRDAVRTAEEQNDPGTVDLFSRHVQIHEKHEWFLRDILEKRDGLVVGV